MEGAFVALNVSLMSSPLLEFTDFDQPFLVETDTSLYAVGAVMVHKKAFWKVHPVQLASMTTKSSERKYSAGERESLGVIFALKKFQIYLLSL